uniref:D-3-phosphoglycerate dehydrogenase n=2 Tax=Gouania willdenowi TaxID=441366 RepID=A0A8C5DE35_GOUWI
MWMAEHVVTSERGRKEPKMAPITIRSVLISESVDPRCRAVLEENGIRVTERPNMKTEELMAEIQNYDGLVVRSATKVTADIINATDNLKIIGRAGTGVDNVDVDAATKKGVIVMNTPSGNTISAAELTCIMLMNLSRNVPQATMSMKQGNWDRKKFMGSELFGKVLGIVGLGRIGKEVASRMQSFGMKTIGYDPITPPEVSASWGVEQMSLEKLWPQCDYITVHTPLMPSTVGLLSDETFALCKRGVKVVNCARGGIIDEAALLRALESGQCGGAGLDVFVEEPPKDRSLVNHPNVISCPHLGASTKEAQARCGEDIALQIVDMVKGKNLIGAVSQTVVLSAALWGKFEMMLINEIKKYSMKTSTGFMTSAVLVGLLDGESGCCPNLINVLSLAKECGIMVNQSHSASNVAAEGLCQVEVGVNGCSYKAIGSVRGGVPVLLELSDSVFRQPVTLNGNLLFFKASADPQLLTSVIGLLAAEGVEVESFSGPADRAGDLWYCVGMSSLIKDLNALKPVVKHAAQLSI